MITSYYLLHYKVVAQQNPSRTTQHFHFSSHWAIVYRVLNHRDLVHKRTRVIFQNATIHS